ncbi:peptidase M16 [bacterium CG_4_9_14_3_um_filter_65_15]|nr:MAG: peptidase M16 [bacterium CG_4_9_14_3_um_filter_65_15]
MPLKNRLLAALTGLALVLAAGSALAQTYLDLENQVREFTLDNGVTFLVLEKHDVPVFSFRTFVNVGSSSEVRGITGLSHILEHMAFKGTAEIGTKDYKGEQKAMAREDEAFDAFKKIRLAIRPIRARYQQLVARIPESEREAYDEMISGAEVSPPDFTTGPEAKAALAYYQAEVKAMEDEFASRQKDFEDAKDAAREFVVTNEYGKIVENNGGQGLNAYTNSDVTVYHYNLPSNRLERWAYLEGSRMADPVLREFYTEKDGPVTEERRMRTDNNPIGRLIEQFENLMFMANGYHHSTIGYMSDLNNISRADCRAYFDKNYVGSNIVVTLVGDVDFGEVQKFAKKYFSDIPAGNPETVETFEPKQLGEKRFVMEDPSQPLYISGFHIHNVRHPDWPVYQVIADVLGQGRTSRLYKSLVKEQKIAVNTAAFPGYPGEKFETGLLVFAMPAKDKTGEDLEVAVNEQIQDIVDNGITAEELDAVKQRTRAGFIRGLDGNGGMAGQLAYYQTYMGDWRELFNEVGRIDAVSLDDVKRVAGEIFDVNNRTVAILKTQDQES